MSLKVILFANYREVAGSKDIVIDSPLTTVKEVVDELTERFPAFIPLFYQNGELKRYVNILVNGITFKDTGGLATPVTDGDEIKLFPPVSGG